MDEIKFDLACKKIENIIEKYKQQTIKAVKDRDYNIIEYLNWYSNGLKDALDIFKNTP